MELLNSEDNAVWDADVRLIWKMGQVDSDSGIFDGEDIMSLTLKRTVSAAIKNNTLNSLYRAVSAWQNDINEIAEYVRVAVTTSLNGQSGVRNGSKIIGSGSIHAVTLIGDNDLTNSIVEAIGIVAMSQGILSTQKYTFEMAGERCPRWLNCVQLAAMRGHTVLIERFHDILNAAKNKGKTDKFVTVRKDKPNGESTACELTPLMLAARFGHMDTVRKLIELKMQCNESDYSPNYRTVGSGYSALHFAACYNSIDAVRELIEAAKADVNAQSRGCIKYAIAFAAALGFVDIVEYLFDGTILAAAATAKDKVISALLSKDSSLKHAEDSKRNTPLAVALRGNHVNTADMLVSFGVRNNSTNATGVQSGEPNLDNTTQSRSSRPKSASGVVARFIQNNRSRRRSSVAGVDAAELLKDNNIRLYHAAALDDDVKQIEELLECNVSPDTVDQRGNTFLHIAAAESRLNVLIEFIPRFEHLVEMRNSYGDTPLHISVSKGLFDATRVLARHVPSLGICDKNGCTPLHVAVKYRREAIVKELIKAIISAGWMSLLDRQDDRGRTALHYAVICFKRSDADCIKTLGALNPGPVVVDASKSVAESSNSALHLAAAMPKTDMLKLIMETFYAKEGRRYSIDELDSSGRTALMICAENGNVDGAELLMNYDAKLDAKDTKGLTVLHRIVLLAVENNDRAGTMLTVYRKMMASRRLSKDCIMDADTSIWESDDNDIFGLRDIFRLGLRDEERSERCKWCAFDEKVDVKKHLLTHVYSKFERCMSICPEGMTVMQLAAAIGADDMLREFLNATNVAKTIIEIDALYFMYRPHNVVPASLFTSDVLVPDISLGPSCLELIAYESCQHAVKMIDVEPLRTFVNKFSRVRSVVFLLLTICHVVHMSCFSWAVLRTSAGFTAGFKRNYTPRSMCGFLVWPSMVFGYLVARQCMLVYRLARRKMHCFGCRATVGFGDDRRVVAQYVIFKIVNYMSSTTFVLLTVAWFWMLSNINNDRYERYCALLSVLFIAGWMHTIEYIKGVEYFNAFSKYLKLIFLQDIVRFGCIYAFVLVGFALAIHVFIQYDVQGVASSNASMLATTFDTFGLMLGVTEVYDTTSGDQFGRLIDGQNPISAKVLFSVYLCVSTIMLLNVLIAMMNTSYKAIEQEIKLLWRYENIKLIVDLSECGVPLILMPTRLLMKRFVFDRKDSSKVRVKLDEQSLTHSLLVYDPTAADE